MALVEPLASNHNDDIAELAKFFNETLGFCPNSVLTMQRRPAIAKAFINLNKAVMENHGQVTAEQKRLIGYITSAIAGCRYCQAHTILAAERYGGSDQRLTKIWNFRASSLYTPAEKAAFEFALAAASIPNEVDDDIAKQLHAHWSDDEIVEILAVISLFGYLNRWNDSMGTAIEDGAFEAADQHLAEAGWEAGKHRS